MSMPMLLSACIGLVVLGTSSYASLGVQHSELLPQTANVKDTEPYGSKQYLQLNKVNQEQYTPSEETGRGTESGAPTKGFIQKRQVQTEENGTYDPEPEDDGPEHLISKRLTQPRRNAEDLGFKSRPGFRSWGGKRSKFTNWGGKRNPSFSRWGGKRSKFNNWGGKRAETSFVNLYDPDTGRILAEEPDVVHSEGKVYGFEKRDREYPSPYEQEGDPVGMYGNYDFLKKDEFQAWADKPIVPAVDVNKFSNWAGKREPFSPKNRRMRPRTGFYDANSLPF